ncbi:hypothetical protein A2875_01455 [Candidatus Gottesmanbacteria bacterium RIFCSPHIGHO2_01_FULL_46_14]|uniref:Uncharacterized protein n=2 Tax=Candidatus Gottesmaniibacteriota TaxID=1752720 RepID=A0A1F5ZIV1_9BACT|nr:MAG: hypothetical protein A2875_01455 [Candidatus Gottesmanbacteria bacterium RIFCSPHIGHO2_01_FULL_46_14]OGG30219.1 MAG: hypothetical protein A2971_02940 [Candidatus Gottesmanbacteria bacterium RIFCSPLOWO2_01_FULL_46_21]
MISYGIILLLNCKVSISKLVLFCTIKIYEKTFSVETNAAMETVAKREVNQGKPTQPVPSDVVTTGRRLGKALKIVPAMNGPEGEAAHTRTLGLIADFMDRLTRSRGLPAVPDESGEKTIGQ